MTAIELLPGVHPLTQEQYHADPVPGGSLSSTGARKLLPPSCPALFKHWRDNGEDPKKAWDIGHAAHKLALGTGPDLVLVDRPRWDTKEVKEQLAEIRARKAVPLKRPEWEQVHGMAEALRSHPWAGALFEPGTGRAEQAIVWREKAAWFEDIDGEPVGRSGSVTCRARIDFLRHPTDASRYFVPDYKSTGAKYGAHPDKIGRSMADWGYHIQLGFYLRGIRSLAADRLLDLGAAQVAIGLLVVQEVTPPYLVTVAEPDRDAMRMAELRITEAINTYAECTATGRWRGYSDDVVRVELPPWETRELNGVVW